MKLERIILTRWWSSFDSSLLSTMQKTFTQFQKTFCLCFILVSIYSFAVFHSLSHIQLCDPMGCSMPGSSLFHSLLNFTHHRVSDAIQPLILCYPLLLLPSVFPSIGVFSNELTLNQINILLLLLLLFLISLIIFSSPMILKFLKRRVC